jgi:hypothetical protein
MKRKALTLIKGRQAVPAYKTLISALLMMALWIPRAEAVDDMTLQQVGLSLDRLSSQLLRRGMPILDLHARGLHSSSSDGTIRIRLRNGQTHIYAVRTDGSLERRGASLVSQEEETLAGLAILVLATGFPTMRATAGGFVLHARQRCEIRVRNPDIARGGLFSFFNTLPEGSSELRERLPPSQRGRIDPETGRVLIDAGPFAQESRFGGYRGTVCRRENFVAISTPETSPVFWRFP